MVLLANKDLAVQQVLAMMLVQLIRLYTKMPAT
jgi:hypothetical protein